MLDTLFSRGLVPCSLAGAAALAHAANAPDGQWHGDVAIGGALASGNTNSKTLTAPADGARDTAADKISLFGNVNDGRNKANGVETTIADQVRAGGRYDYNPSDAALVFGGGDGEINKAAGLDSRYNLDTGLGHKVIHDAATTFDVYGGLGWSHAKFVDRTSGQGATALVGEEPTHKPSDSTTFKQRAEFHPGAKAIGNLATFDAGLATEISGGWTLNTALSVRYASKLPAGLKSTGTLLAVGLGDKL